jgi:hypothetical protein
LVQFTLVTVYAYHIEVKLIFYSDKAKPIVRWGRKASGSCEGWDSWVAWKVKGKLVFIV